MQFFILPKNSDSPTEKIDPPPSQNLLPKQKHFRPSPTDSLPNFYLSPPLISEGGMHVMTVFFKLLKLYVNSKFAQTLSQSDRM